MVEFLQVGAITATHGLKGEVKVFPTTDDKLRFKKLKKCIWQKGSRRQELEVQSCRFFKEMVILKFKGIDDINDVEPYVKGDLYVDRENAVPCEEGEYFIADLVGMKVIDEEGQNVGTLTEVLSTGANDVYIVKSGDKEILIPAIGQCILEVQVEQALMKVHLLDGLVD